jgi:hypothetical protein
MKISKIYENYPIPILLKQHHLKAAAVGAYICDNLKDKNKANKNLIIKSLLLHDLGNIIKFNFEKENFLTEEEKKNIEYWKKEREIYRNKYHNDEHLATYEIVRELGLIDIYEVLIHTGSSKLQAVLESPNYNLKIVTYADLRCAPFSIVTIDGRFDDVINRYRGGAHQLSNINEVEQRRKRGLELEIQLQKEALINLKDISDQDIKKYLDFVSQEEI